MHSFLNDYSEGAHPKVLQALTESNLRQTCGYGLDPDCQKAADLIRKLCNAPDAAVHFLVGGTQTNLVAIDALLKPYEAVIAASTGHVSRHETGAIEASGHKVCTVSASDGKLTPELVESVLNDHDGTEHMVSPRFVYISNTTETGTVYNLKELQALRACCDAHGLLLYLDGARLGSAIAAGGPSLPELAALTDAFYIGGTKNGALFGEALVLARPQADFRWYIKRRGAMLAKGRLLGVQFQALLEDGLYFDIARHANELALRLREGVRTLGYPLMVESPSNQQFFILPKTVFSKLTAQGCEFEVEWEKADQVCIRLVTSWATPPAAIDEFLQALAAV